ncbi:MAG: phosphatase PAP2 family protein [Candidatus Binataceae bacterium]
MVRNLLNRLDQLEAPIVKWVATGAQRPVLKTTGRVVNRLGNGWLYLAIAITAIAVKGLAAIPIELFALAAVGLAFVVYYPLKSGLARTRPCDRDPSLQSTISAMDTYSFPSGHYMSLCAVGTVFSWYYPNLVPLVVSALLLMGWNRLALAHHYPSDLIVGMVIGVTAALVLGALL